MFKIVAICYFLFITFNFASSYTGASFNKTVAITGFLAATIPEEDNEHSKQEQKQLPVEEPIRENNGKENEVKKEQSNETLMKENENQENHSKDEMKENGAQQIEQNKTETKSNDIHLKEQQSAKQEQVSNALEQNEPPLQ